LVKGHPLHPGTSELIASAICRAVQAVDLHPGVFSFLHAGGSRERAVGEELIDHPCVRAAGFTGSYAGGIAVIERGRARPEPIPVFAEMGSINPVICFKHALETRGPAIAERIAQAIINASGQMCTKPGLLIALRDKHTDAFAKQLAQFFNTAEPGMMLGTRLRDAFVLGIEEHLRIEGVEAVAGSVPSITSSQVAAAACPVLLRCRAEVFLREPRLRNEVFGPGALLVVCEHEEELFACLGQISGSLTGSLFAGTFDAAFVARTVPMFEQRVGRIVFNGVPTGIEVNSAMVHGGPAPASNLPHSSAQGGLALERWCRPVCYQNAPDVALPPALRDANPLGIERVIATERTRDSISRGTRASASARG
jgi:NADP-dependent aldehyde dehydrogenase